MKRITARVLRAAACALVFAAAGCSSVPSVPYYIVSEFEGASAIYFDNGISPLFFEDIEIPQSERTRWNPLYVPADEAFSLSIKTAEKEAVLTCPALEAGKDYRLTVGKSAAELLDAEDGAVIYKQEL